ncbi:Notch ligand involved in the mediation of Notch signaling (By similarity) [Seminavis robusta]|uniref:Notch ligand involved in the mediation of Notch signaling By similarity n=1 Tax=Seminavis robusta TaxID=568900 RepID=A0A9N8HC50_9STRA|nr:Notch ligand involved in the mediation of Notch signaling (By similarity) [Seminavis robusta]|eukprot:Sro305_g112740.1 Notch ligand involved in the mediation of Notch signaling (By similarity) (638) ;mRNA; r:23521-25711
MKTCGVAALAVLSTLALSRSANAQALSNLASASCPLNCQADGACARGNADFSEFMAIANNVPFMRDRDSGGFYCQCPPGRTGLLCEREYQTCGDGAHFCFHGGKCLTGLKDAFGVDQHYCDCGDAEFEGKNYAGKYCEAEAVDVCGIQPEFGVVFCTNGGKCRENFMDYLDQPCICQNGFEGPHCEYEHGKVPGCDLMCENDGHCRIGSKDYPPNEAYREFWKTHDDNRYCACKPGYFGLQCEIQGQRCGDEHCFNGATCVDQEMGDGTTRHFCDCTTANDRGSSFAGQRCESESTSFCTKLPDHNGHQFCVNGGQCRMDSHLGCDCLEGFNGPICEFRDSVNDNSEECKLTCKHNGVCRRGAKDVGFLKKFNVDMPNLEATASNNFEHCVCPKGYVGLQCEHRVEVCPGGESICMNGASCVPDDSDGRLRYKCDCDSVHTPFHKYAGDFCELRSTDMCTLNGRVGAGLNKHAFCVNGGRCRDHVGENDKHPGCTCPTGFEGEHCQKLTAAAHIHDSVVEDLQTNNNESSGGEGGGLSTGGTLAIVLFVNLAAIGAVAYFFYRRQSRAASFEPRPTNLMARDAPQPPTLEEVLSKGSFHDYSERSNSHCSRVHDDDDDGDGIFKVDEKANMVNVAII